MDRSAAILHARVSIIIPVRNEAGLISNSLGRLQEWRRAGHEVIVVDGGSSDGTPVDARPLADRVLSCPPGRAAQMNAGAARASGEILLFLHVDTMLPEGALSDVAGVCATREKSWGRFDTRLSGRHLLFRVIERMMNLRSRLTGVATGDQALFLNRAWFEEIGGFPDIPLMEDIAFSKKLRRASRPQCLTAVAITSSRRWEERGILRTVILMWLLRAGYSAGVPSRSLARFYNGG